MIQFFKLILSGLLYIVISPLIALVLALFLVIGIIVFVLQFFKAIILFFTGRKLSSDYPEDIAAKKILGQLRASAPLAPTVEVKSHD